MSAAVKQIIEQMAEIGIILKTAANLANKKALDSVGALIEDTK